MSYLDVEQIGFLIGHNISLDETFDATGMKRAQYHRAMKERGLLIAYGVTPCPLGHTLRTRHGDCVQCRPAKIAFARRATKAGYVYAAISNETLLCKLGFSQNPWNRIYIANLEGYAGVRDWRIFLTVETQRGGVLESAIARRLDEDRVFIKWIRNWHEVEAREIYRCAEEDIIIAVEDESNDDEIATMTRWNADC